MSGIDYAPNCYILQAGDTYTVRCSCGWEALDVADLESAGEVKRLHLGDDHCPDCGAVVTTLDRVCEACEEASGDESVYIDGHGWRTFPSEAHNCLYQGDNNG